MRKLFIFIAVLFMVAAFGPVDKSSLTISRATAEYLENPQGLDVPTPRFSWILESSGRGTGQSAYQIIVSRSKKLATRGVGDIWDTGKVESGQSINISYDGDPLESVHRYFWRVRVWDQDGNQGSWNTIQHFQMGLLNPGDWQAQWITHSDSTVSSPLFRNDFIVDKEVESATAFVTGVGYYEFYLNGEKVGDHVLDPVLTDPRERIFYQTFDVTEQLMEGKNAWGLWLGNGAFRLKAEQGRWTWYGMDNRFGTPMGIVQLHLQFRDGSEKIIGSDGDWKTDASPVIYNNVYGGEDYDARLEQEGWSTIDFEDSLWASAVVVEKPDVMMSAQVMPPIRVVETIKPVKETHPKTGTYLYDLEQNIPGWWRLQVRGSRGTEIKIRGAETLNNERFPKHLEPGDSLSTDKPFYRDVWTTYILRGEGVETYEPRFFYTGFRYIEVVVDDPELIHSMEIEAQVVHTDLERNGTFSSSDTLLNRIYEAAIWSQRGNWHGYPEDCPHREKGGYNGDGLVVAETSIHDFHMQPLYRKWFDDMRDAQENTGRIPNTSPTVIGGMGGGIAWGSAYIQMPWWLYLYYEDVEILKEHYPTMQFYMEYLEELAQNDNMPEEKYIIGEFGSFWTSLGEWCAPGESDGPNRPVTSTFYWYLNNKFMANIAEVLGHEDDRNKYVTLADSIKNAFNKTFFDRESYLYGADEPNQTFLLYALAGGLVPEGFEEHVFNTLIDDIMVRREGHAWTGILGTKHLFPVLAGAGREDVLHSVVSKTTYPGWGYWIENGMTTLGEQWDGQGSLNHQMFGSVSEYFYKYLAGIRAPTDPGTTAGYQTIQIKPYVPGNLEYAEASVETIRGRVASHWQKQEGGLRLDVSVPVSSSANVSIPSLGYQDIVISESGKIIWSQGQFVEGAEGVATGRMDGDYVTFEITSGTYAFELGSL